MAEGIFKSLILIYLTAVVLLDSVQAKHIRSDARIIRGQVTTIEKAPFAVQLRNHYNQLTCGGALVTPRHIVTAAHCVEDVAPERITVVGGANKSSDEGTSRQDIEEIFIHPDYKYETANADIAVLKLKEELKGANISTIPLCNKYLENFDFIQVFGWGWTEEGSRVTEDLRTINIPVFAQDYCVDQYKNFYKHITDNMMCAAIPGITDSCTGDSGGPAIYEKQLCGVVSWGNGCGSAAYPGVYARISELRDFIEKYIKS